MLEKVKKLIICILCAVIALLTVPITNIQAEDYIQKYNIAIKKVEPIYVGQIGEKIEMRVSQMKNVFPTYKSSNTKVLKVDNNGNLTPVKAGKATITMTSNGNVYKRTVVVKDPKKEKKIPVFEQVSSFEYGKKYKIRTLNGYKIKSIKPNKGLEVFGNSTIKLTPSDKLLDGEKYPVYTTVTFADGNEEYVCFSAETKQRVKALNVVKNAMSDMGITSESSDLEKITAVYNWLALNTEYDGDEMYDGGYNYYAVILNKKGDCDAFTQAIHLFCEYLGIMSVNIYSPRHVYNGVCIDGKWYAMDGTHCCGSIPYAPQACRFLVSARFCGLRNDEPDYADYYNIKVSSKSTYKGISFNNTEYDNKNNISFFQQMKKDYGEIIWYYVEKDWCERYGRESEEWGIYDTETNEYVDCMFYIDRGLCLPDGYKGTLKWEDNNSLYGRYVIVHP